ncbi:MAG TPA: MinD/ParA family protein [Anaerolineales bacterium]|nr:MinD/ParA family protein [Anaerolineales bacterium]
MGKGKIVSIHSFRGGTGKSNTTANLAGQVAMAGHRVGIVDTDIQSPGIHVLFGLDEASIEHSLNEFLYQDMPIKDIAFSIGENVGDAAGRQKLAGKDIWLVPSSISTKDISRVLREGYDANKLNEGMQNFISEMDLDYLFIDTHPGINEETLLSLTVSDILILILRPDQQDFQGTIVTVDIARMLDVPHLFLAVNKVLSRYDPVQVKEAIEDQFECEVAGVMPLTEDLVELASSDLISLKDPGHPWSVALKGIAQAIIEAD